MELRPEIVSELWHSDLIESEDCGLEESQEFYRQVKEGRNLPPDVWQIGDTARFIRLKDGAPSPAELQQLLQFKQIELLKSIRRMVAFLAVLTVIGLGLGNLLGGMVLVETIFNWPGVGQFAYESVLSVDYPSIIGVALLIALNYMVINTVVDILYGVIDPRVRCNG